MPLVAKCGSESGYNKHKRDGTKVCTPCQNAYREATRNRKRKSRANSKTSTKGARSMNTIEEHETIINDLERAIEILNQAIETEEPKSNRNLSGLARALADLHEKVAEHKAAIAELKALDNEESEDEADDPFDAFARALHEISTPEAKDSQELSVGDTE